jgi:hypothetical protein
MKKKKDNIISIVFLILLFIVYLIYRNYRNKEELALSAKGKTTIGRIIERDIPYSRTISSISYHFIYYVHHKKYEDGSLSDKKFKVGSFFEVSYLPDNPEKSKMLFSKPVHPDSVCTYFENDCPFNIEENKE